MKVNKHPLVSDRIRRPPKEGWSWIDRRFLPELAPLLEQNAILLYFFLVAVSDKNGVSYYSDRGIAKSLRMDELAVAAARDELESHDLIADECPRYQGRSLPPSRPRRRSCNQGESGLTPIGEIFRQLAADKQCEDRIRPQDTEQRASER